MGTIFASVSYLVAGIVTSGGPLSNHLLLSDV